MKKNLSHECQCSCGSTKYSIQAEPICRIYCHCTICQEFNDEAYSDVSIYMSKDVQLHDNEKVSFKKYKSPPALQRGKCTSCEQPIIEFLDFPLMPSLTIIPSKNIPSKALSLKPAMHIFYHRRVSDIDDSLPKYSGFIKSQLVLSAKIMSGIIHKVNPLK